jgi:hypothetical protein
VPAPAVQRPHHQSAPSPRPWDRPAAHARCGTWRPAPVPQETQGGVPSEKSHAVTTCRWERRQGCAGRAEDAQGTQAAAARAMACGPPGPTARQTAASPWCSFHPASVSLPPKAHLAVGVVQVAVEAGDDARHVCAQLPSGQLGDGRKAAAGHGKSGQRVCLPLPARRSFSVAPSWLPVPSPPHRFLLPVLHCTQE